MTERATDQPEYTEETIDLCVGAGARLEGEFLQITDEETILPTTKNWVLMAVIMCNILDRLEALEQLGAIGSYDEEDVDAVGT